MRYIDLFEDEDIDPEVKQKMIQVAVDFIDMFMGQLINRGNLAIDCYSLSNRVAEQIDMKFNQHLGYYQAEEFTDEVLKITKEKGIAMRDPNRPRNIIPGPNNTVLKATMGNLQPLIDEIENNCTEIIGVYKSCNRFLHRGMKDRGLMFKHRTRDNRRPLDTPGSVHESLDTILKSMGFAAVRSNSAFCTSDSNTANGYGTVYIIFPKNGFDFTYWGNATDFFEYMNEKLSAEGYDTIETKEDRKSVPRRTLNYLKGKLKDIVESAKPQNQNLADGLSRRSEIMIANTEYIAVHHILFATYLKEKLLGY